MKSSDSREPGAGRPPAWWRTAAVVAVVVAASIVIVMRAGIFGPGAPDFERVIEAIGRAEDVSYQATYHIDGMESFSTRHMVDREGKSRKELAAGSVMIHIPQEGKQLTLNRSSRKATLIHRSDAGERLGILENLDWAGRLRSGTVRFAGRGAVNDRETNLFVNDEDPHYRVRLWADAATDLPVRVEIVSDPNPASNVIVPTLVLYKSSFGSSSTESRAISYSAKGGITIPARIAIDDFTWDAGIDQSLFSLRPPSWYKLEEDTLDVTDSTERDLVRALELWASMSGGLFPDDINDLGDLEKANPLLVSTYDGDGDPEREFDEAMKAANVLLKGCVFAQEMKLTGSWRYAGKGIAAGDSRAPVCWWRAEGAGDFRILYGDLRVEDVGESMLPE